MDSSLSPYDFKPISWDIVKLALKKRKRMVMSWLIRRFFNLFARMEIKGLEHIPEEGNFLVLPNHLSNLDAPLILGYFPRQLEMVGPGDFKMKSSKTCS